MLMINQTTPEDLVRIVLMGVKRLLDEKFDNLLHFGQSQSEVLLTTEETCDFLKIDAVTLWRWQKENLIVQYGIKGKRYYKKSELLNSLQRMSNSSVLDIT